MDNQFKGKNPRPKYRGMKEESESDEELLDYIYRGYKKDVAKAEAEEVEKLKHQAGSDFLRVYGFVRGKVVAAKRSASKFLSGLKRLFVGRRKLGYSVLALLAITGIGFALIGDMPREEEAPSDTLGVQQADASFETLQPEGGAEGKYDSERAIWSFQAQYEGSSITITQQQLPSDLENETTTLQQLALSLSDKTSINRRETEKGLLFIVNLTGGSQRAMFAHENLLVFMESLNAISDDKWVGLVNSLTLQ